MCAVCVVCSTIKIILIKQPHRHELFSSMRCKNNVNSGKKKQTNSSRRKRRANAKKWFIVCGGGEKVCLGRRRQQRRRHRQQLEWANTMMCYIHTHMHIETHKHTYVAYVKCIIKQNSSFKIRTRSLVTPQKILSLYASEYTHSFVRLNEWTNERDWVSENENGTRFFLLN